MPADFTADSTITVRHATLNDATALIALKKGYINGTTSIPMYVHEYTNTIAQEEEWIYRFLKPDNSVLFVAECNGALIGNLDLSGSTRQKLAHTAMLGMGVAWDWQGKKVGTLLMETAMEWASQNSMLSIIWLEVYANNIAGIKLYKKSGFEECGVIKDFFREGTPVDKITMVKYLM